MFKKQNLQFIWISGLMLFLTLVFPLSLWADTGNEKWNVQRGSRMDSSPAIRGDGRVYIGSDDDRLYAFDHDGEEIWHFQTGGDISSSPAIGADGTIYICSHDTYLYAVNEDGEEKWRFKTGGSIKSSPGIGDDGVIYIGSDDGILYAVNSEGTEKWRFDKISAPILSSPGINNDGTVYVGSSDSWLYAVNSDGTQKWVFETGAQIVSSPALGADGTVYIGSSDHRLYAVNTDGKEKWHFETGGSVKSSPVIRSDGIVYIGSDDHYLYAVQDNEDRGTEKWKFLTSGTVESTPFIGAGGNIYFSASDSMLYALDMDGKQKWSLNINGNKSSPVITHDKTLYIGSGNGESGRLYAVETESEGIHRSAWPMRSHDVRHTGRNTVNSGPAANAGEDQSFVSGDEVTLDGSASSDPDYGIASYSWRQTGGETVTLSDENTAKPTFKALDVDDEESLTFELTVTDNGGIQSTDTVNIRVEEDDSFCFIKTAF